MTHYYLTLTTQNVAYELSALIEAASPGANVSAPTRIVIQSAKGNAGDIYIGGSGLSATNYGRVLLTAGDSAEISNTARGVYVLGDAASQIISVLFL